MLIYIILRVQGTPGPGQVSAFPTPLPVDFHNGSRYAFLVIRSFRDRTTERLFDRRPVRKLGPDLQRAALRKLRQLDAAVSLEDLRVPPGNRLERLHGDRAGEYRIRINDQ